MKERIQQLLQKRKKTSIGASISFFIVCWHACFLFFVMLDQGSLCSLSLLMIESVRPLGPLVERHAFNQERKRPWQRLPLFPFTFFLLMTDLIQSLPSSRTERKKREKEIEKLSSVLIFFWSIESTDNSLKRSAFKWSIKWKLMTEKPSISHFLGKSVWRWP